MEEKKMEGVLSALGNSTRMGIIYELNKREKLTSSNLAKALGKKPSTIAFHLSILRKAGIVTEPEVITRANYLEKYYRLSEDYAMTASGSLRKADTQKMARHVLTELTLIQGLANRTKKAITADASKANKILVTIATGTKEGYERFLRSFNEQKKEKKISDLPDDHTIVIMGIPPLEHENVG